MLLTSELMNRLEARGIFGALWWIEIIVEDETVWIHKPKHSEELRFFWSKGENFQYPV